MEIKGSVSIVNQSKQGTQVTVESEDGAKLIIFNKATNFAEYTVGQNLTVTVAETPVP